MDVRSAELYKHKNNVFQAIRSVVSVALSNPAHYPTREFLAVVYVLSLFEEEDIDV